MGPLFGLASAFSWGAGDFCGGLASRISSVVTAILASQAVGLLATLLILLASGEALPPLPAIAWGAVAGLSGVIGLGAFYAALSRGTMGLIAPLAALIGASLPAIVAIAGGEELGALRLGGIALGLLAVVLISLPGGERTAAERRAVRIDLAELPLVLISGLGFAGFYLFLDRAANEGGETWWPLLAVRGVGFCVIVGVVLLLLARDRGRTLRQRADTLFGLSRLRLAGVGLLSLAPPLLLAGAGDLGGNAFFVLANAEGALAVAVVLSSLYPVVTTVLAAIFLGERLRPLQFVGIGLAVLAVVLIGR
ncbi:MAG TPA: EamA family transporter [Candidatus Limnocylindria bacterium]|nr:EamA family transporter [Candidatus Limnocylindria bacterium]